MSEKQIEEQGHESMQNQSLDRVDNHVFLSSKGDSIVNLKSIHSPLIDDELVTWLQYPLEDDACPDIFQHWPPASLACATTGVLAASPITNTKELLHQETDAFMVTVGSERLLQVAEGRRTDSSDETVNVLLKQAPHENGVSIDYKERVDGSQRDSLQLMNAEGSTSTNPVRQAGPYVDERQNVPRDCRNLSQREAHLQAESNFWVARESLLASSSTSQSKHTFAESKIIERQNSTNTPSKLSPQLHAERRSSLQYRAPKEPGQVNPTADAALALGAGRAAGAIRALGTEAFSKVRTSVQSPHPLKLGSPPSPLMSMSPSGKGVTEGPSSPSMLPPRARPVGFHAVIPFNQQNFQLKPQPACQPYFTRPSTTTPAAQEHQFLVRMRGSIKSNENSLKESPVEFSMTASVGSQSKEHAQEGANACSAGRTIPSQNMDAPDIRKLSGTSSLSPEKRGDAVFSGDSESSESLKETFSGSKRKLEDSECQSEDAEGESTVNSQSKNASSKRTRANEVHNLSERRRRNRINDKMNALRELIPNASKTNKAALLDEAIDYLKNLQLQLQVMSVRTGMNLSPMVVPSGLPHMQSSQIRSLYQSGIGTLGGSSTGVVSAGSPMGVAMCNMTYGVPARSLGSVTNSDPRMLQSPEKSSFSQVQTSSAPESLTMYYPHSFVQTPSQSMFPVNMDMCNSFFQQHHLQQQQQQQQQQKFQQNLHHHEHSASPQVQASSPPSPSSQQQAHYQL